MENITLYDLTYFKLEVATYGFNDFFFEIPSCRIYSFPYEAMPEKHCPFTLTLYCNLFFFYSFFVYLKPLLPCLNPVPIFHTLSV